MENKEKAQALCDCVVNWATEMTKKQSAHVVFISSESLTATQNLRKSEWV